MPVLAKPNQCIAHRPGPERLATDIGRQRHPEHLATLAGMLGLETIRRLAQLPGACRPPPSWSDRAPMSRGVARSA